MVSVAGHRVLESAALLPYGRKEEKKDHRTKSDQDRATDFIMQLKDTDDNSPVKQGIRWFFKWGVKPLLLIIWAYVWLFRKLYAVYLMMPTNVIKCVFGIGLCCCGGAYFAAIAAVEAAVHLGGADMWDHLKTCWEDANTVAEASAVDDTVDADKDGVADVEQISMNELLSRKAKLAMKSVQNPDRLQKALFALINVYIAVIATLKFQFARTVAISLGIADMLIVPASRIAGPPLAMIMGPDLNHWVPTTIDTALKVFAVVIATYIQAFISAFYSALKGGKIFSEAVLNIFTERGWMEKLPDWMATKPFDPDKSYLDELLAYPVAVAGVYLQVTNGFGIIFPFNIILFPLTAIEWFLRFEIFT